MKINEIKQEGKVSLKALITKCDKAKTQKQTPYLSLMLEDQSGVLDTKFWNLTEEMVEKYHVGMIVSVHGDVLNHKGGWQLRVHKMDILDDENINDYVRNSPMERNEMEEAIDEYISMIENEQIRLLTSTIVKESQEDFYTYPAAVRNHHNFVGGLAYHSISMIKLALSICDLYEFLDRDLLISATILHDIGKIEEYSAPVLPEYTTQGNLLGHISMMVARIDRVAHELGLEDKESVMLIKHMVLSHHGKLEFGSPVLPMIPEAEVLCTIDNLDARLFMMKQSIDTSAPGGFGPRMFALENRMIYHRKDKK